MRWPARIVTLALAIVATDASAKRVVMDPPVVRACRTGKTWNDVTACLGKMGTPVLARTLTGGARLVAMTKQKRTWIELGLYLYTPHGGEWQLGGLWESNGMNLLLDAKPITVTKHSGYRIDVGQSFSTAMPQNFFGGRNADVRINHTVFCRGDTWGCIDMVTSCEVAMAGKAVWTFRGTLTIDNKGLVKVVGDRRNAGPLCNFTDRLYLGWTES